MEVKNRTWVEVDTGCIERNYKALCRKAGKSAVLGVVKADAYGHGAVEVARVLQKAGCPYLAVACIDEAAALRAAGICVPVLILGYTSPEYTDHLISMNITQTVSSLQMARELSAQSVASGGVLKVHLKIDSGMGRTGFAADNIHEIAEAAVLPGLETEGIYTHFAVADSYGDSFTGEQFSRFCGALDELKKIGLTFSMRHCANSGALINYPDTYLDMVRPGIALYGHYPEEGRTGGLELQPAMELKTRVSQIKSVKPGDTISYGRMYTAEKQGRIAVISIGYADGLRRGLSGNMDVIINGQRCPQIGRICMDMCMVDVTEMKDIKPGDVVTIFGRDGDEFIPAEELSCKLDTISYEVLCGVSHRVPRVYVNRET